MGGAAAVFGIYRELFHATGFHGRTDLAFDQRLDEHGDEVAAQQPFDAGGVVQEHRRDQLGALQLGVAFLQVGLVFVGGEQFRVGEVAVVADQREAAVGGGVVSDLLLVDGVGDAVVGAGAAAVAGVGAGSAAWHCQVGALPGRCQDRWS